MSDRTNKELQIPVWLPLNKLERELLEICASGPYAMPEDKQKSTRMKLFSRGLIRRLEPTEAYQVPQYLATDKGRRALAIDNIMRRLGMARQPQPIYRYPETDLSELLMWEEVVELG
jgi:hypothetical protein